MADPLNDLEYIKSQVALLGDLPERFAAAMQGQGEEFRPEFPGGPAGTGETLPFVSGKAEEGPAGNDIPILIERAVTNFQPIITPPVPDIPTPTFVPAAEERSPETPQSALPFDFPERASESTPAMPPAAGDTKGESVGPLLAQLLGAISELTEAIKGGQSESTPSRERSGGSFSDTRAWSPLPPTPPVPSIRRGAF